MEIIRFSLNNNALRLRDVLVEVISYQEMVAGRNMAIGKMAGLFLP
jgi:hypothetical protein